MKFCMGCMEQYEDEFDVCPHCGYIEGTPAEESYYMEPGSILNKHYIVGKVIGTGGFGTTYIGWDYELGRKVAIKEYLPKEFSTRVKGMQDITIYPGEKEEQFQSGIEKFIEEARRLVKFKTVPGIVKFYNCFEENKTAYIIMEYLEGQTLKEILQDNHEEDGTQLNGSNTYKVLPYKEARHIMDCLLDALEEVHNEGIIHRDIAPDNVFITKDGQVKLIDFGASRFATTRHSRSLTVLIKEGYAPQEQYRSRGDQGPWTDVYSVAATFYTMVTGQILQDAMEREGKDLVKRPSKLGVKGIPRHVENAIMNALNRKVEDRTPNCEEFKRQLSDENTKWNFIRQRKIDIGRWPLWLKITSGTGAAAVATFLVLLLTGVISFSGIMSVFAKKSEVPYVVGDSQQVAEEAIEEAGFNCVYANYVEDEEIAKDCVYNQIPGANVELAQGEIVYLSISCGTLKKEMPNLEGYNAEVAQEKLSNLNLEGLQVEVVPVTDTKISAGAAPNTVVRQLLAGNEVAEGTEVNDGMVITLEVASESSFDVSKMANTPNFVDASFDDAKLTAYENKVQLTKIGEKYSDQPKDVVLEQSVPEGQQVTQGENVNLTVSAGSEIPIGLYQGKKKADVISQLETMGINVEWSEEESKKVPAGRIISQSVEPGQTMNYKETLKLVVSKGSSDIDIDEDKVNEIIKATPAPAPKVTETPKKKQEAKKSKSTQPKATKNPTSTAVPKTENKVVVPDVTGKTETDARASLSNGKLNYTRTYKFDKTVKEYDVISQSPSAGASVTEGTEVTIVVSKGKEAPSGWTEDASFKDSEWYTCEPKEQYLKQTRTAKEETTTSSNSNLDGWTKYDTKWSAYGSWSGWSRNAVSSSESREVDTRNIPATYKTQYNYSRWASKSNNTGNVGPFEAAWSGVYCKYYFERGWSDSPLEVTGKQYSNRLGGYFNMYGPGSNWFNETTRSVEVSSAYTEYRYRDRSRIYYYKRTVYGSWSDGEWVDDKPKETTSCRIKSERTLYKYTAK